MIATRSAVALVLLVSLSGPAIAQKKNEPKDRPQLTLAVPFVVAQGKPTKVVLRGLKLDGVTDVRCHEPKSAAKFIGKPAKANVPDAKLIPQLGDIQIEVEVTVPAQVAAGEVELSVVGPGGESNLVRLLIDDGAPVLAEREPNNGFKHAQPISIPQTVDGTIQSAQDVDVFRIDGKAAQRLTIDVLATRYGSALDPVLTVFDERGQTVAVSDETDRSNNLRLNVKLPQTGTYYLSLADANDQGGPFHRYRLVCRQTGN